MTIFDALNDFAPLSRETFALLEEQLRPMERAKGDFLVLPGQVQRHLYFVQEGVQMAFAERRGKLHVMAFTYPHNVAAIPESFARQEPSPVAFQCLTDSRLLCLPHESLQRLLATSHELERYLRQVTELLLAGVVSRMRELQTSTMEERFRAFCERSPHLLQLVPHKYIASYLHIDPTNFSKLYNRIRI